MPSERMQFEAVDVLIGLAALDIVVNKLERHRAFNYELGEKLLSRLVKSAKFNSTMKRVNRREARCTLQAIRLSLRHVGNAEMSDQARPIIDKLERFANHA